MNNEQSFLIAGVYVVTLETFIGYDRHVSKFQKEIILPCPPCIKMILSDIYFLYGEEFVIRNIKIKDSKIIVSNNCDDIENTRSMIEYDDCRQQMENNGWTFVEEYDK